MGQKVDEELLENIENRLPKKTDSFSIDENGQEQLVTYIFNKNLNQLFVYTMPYHYINSEVYTLLKRILIVALFLVLSVCCNCLSRIPWNHITNPKYVGFL